VSLNQSSDRALCRARPRLVRCRIEVASKLLVESQLIVRPVEPDLCAIDMAPSQEVVQVREARISRQRQARADVPHTVGSWPSHVLTHDGHRTRPVVRCAVLRVVVGE
jgi:hypothetical protein